MPTMAMEGVVWVKQSEKGYNVRRFNNSTLQWFSGLTIQRFTPSSAGMPTGSASAGAGVGDLNAWYKYKEIPRMAQTVSNAKNSPNTKCNTWMIPYTVATASPNRAWRSGLMGVVAG